MMEDGFIVVCEHNWKVSSPEQRDEMIFNTLRSIDKRLKKLEKKLYSKTE